MRIQIETYLGGGIGCLSEQCAYTRTCANHVTAGDYRSEGGFSPEIRQEDDKFFCDTADRPLGECYYNCNDNYPSGDLDQGSINMKHVLTRSCINYQI
jgi:hypothetical protein